MGTDRHPVTTGVTTMRAVVQDTYGEADVLRPEVIDRPVIGADEVLIRVHAAGVDRGVRHLMTGLPYPLRLAGYGVGAPKERVRGREVAGRVEAVGPDVRGFGIGDEVYGVGEGCFAEYARASQHKIAPAPTNLTPVQAAAVPISGLTALQAVRDAGKVQPGRQVLVIGASGGVGTFAVQIAAAFGATVTGVCSTAKTGLVRSLGADRVLDYTRDEIDGRYDVVLDAGGHRSLTALRRLLTPSGTLVIIGSETGGRWLGGIDRPLRAVALSAVVRQSLGTVMCSENAADLAVLTGLLESGRVTPAVDRTFPLDQAADAVRHMAGGHARGKVVVTV